MPSLFFKSKASALRPNRTQLLGPTLNKVGGTLERIGSTLLNYRAPEIDHLFDDGDTLDIFGGLEVISLPGHTLGHCGFLLGDRRILFASDLFANHLGTPKPPPRIFNDDHEEALASIIKASELPIDGVFLSHGRKESPEDALRDLKKLADRLS